MGFVQQLPKPLELALLEQLGREPRARRLPNRVYRARAERLGQRPLEPGQPFDWPAREPHELRQLNLEAPHDFVTLGAALRELTRAQVVARAGIDQQQPRAKRDLLRLERRALEQERVILLAERGDRLIHRAAAHADLVVLGAIGDAGELPRRQRLLSRGELAERARGGQRGGRPWRENGAGRGVGRPRRAPRRAAPSPRAPRARASRRRRTPTSSSATPTAS